MKTPAPLLDTNIIIDVLNGSEPARDYIKSLSVLRVPSIAVFEVLTGCTGKREKQKPVALEIFEACEIVDFSKSDAEHAAELFNANPSKKRTLDYFIEGTAHTHALGVATRNPRDFQSVDAFRPYHLD